VYSRQQNKEIWAKEHFLYGDVLGLCRENQSIPVR
jgi:hypothetical protein